MTIPSFKDNYVPNKKFHLDFSLSSSPIGPSDKVKQALIEKISGNAGFFPYPNTGYPKLTKVQDLCKYNQ